MGVRYLVHGSSEPKEEPSQCLITQTTNVNMQKAEPFRCLALRTKGVQSTILTLSIGSLYSYI